MALLHCVASLTHIVVIDELDCHTGSLIFAMMMRYLQDLQSLAAKQDGYFQLRIDGGKSNV